MPHPSARKGAKGELELARILSDLTGERVRRKLGAGRREDEGDIEGLADTTVECKVYADVVAGIRKGLADVERERANAGTPFAVSFSRLRGGLWVACQTPEMFCTMWREATKP
jgi:hypothetical protein